MSSNEFLKQMDEAGEKFSGGEGAGIIGRVLIEFGFHRWVSGHDFWEFWQPVPNPAQMNAIASELKTKMQEAGSTDSPSFGIKVTVKKNVLNGKLRDKTDEEIAATGPGKTTDYKRDLEEFTPKWQDGYGLLYDSINENSLPIGELFFGRVQHKANPHFIKKGEVGKIDEDQDGNPRYPSIRVPVEKFADETAARAAVVSGEADGGTITFNQLSEKAQSQFSSIDNFLAQASGVHEWYNKALKGEAMPTKPLEDYLKQGKLDKETGKIYIADCYGLEFEDVEILLKEIPF